MTEKTPIQRFYEKGAEFMARATEGRAKGTVTFPTIKPGMPEWNHWAAYFQLTCGSLPAAMRDVERGIIESMTVPTILPEWFDTSYRTPDYIPVREDRWKTVPAAQRVESFDRVMARLAREPMPSKPTSLPPPGTIVTWSEIPDGTRIIGRFDRTWNGAVKNPVAADRPRHGPRSLEASGALLATIDRQTREAAE